MIVKKSSAGGHMLGVVAQIAGCHTPDTMPDAPNKGTNCKNVAAGLGNQAKIMGWATPTARDGKGIDPHYRNGGINHSLPNQVAGWATPQVADSNKVTPRSKQDSMVKQIIGQMQSSSPTKTGKRGVLNPALARWLMGYPAEWDSCGVTAMQSLRR